MKTHTLTALIALSSHSLIVNAQTSTKEDDHDHKLEHVLVSVPFQKKEAETALPITVLDGEALRNLAAATLGDTLQAQPGLNSASFGPAVGQPVIRGQQGPRVSVLQNGLQVGDASSVSADHGVAVEPVLAETIEVLRGPATLLYGGGAIGGVANVIDQRIPKKLEEASLAMELRHGTVNKENTGVFRIDGSKNSFAYHIDGIAQKTSDVSIPGDAIKSYGMEEDHDHEEHDHEEGEHTEAEHGEEEHADEDNTHGYIANTDSSKQAFTVGGSYIFDRGVVGLAFNAIDSEYGIPLGAHVHHEEHHDEHSEEGEMHEDEHHEDEGIRIDMQKKRADFYLAYNFSGSVIESIDLASSITDYQHDELEGGIAATTYKRDLAQTNIQLSHAQIGLFHGVAGLQYQSSNFSAQGEEKYIPNSDTESLGLYLVENMHTDLTTIELGARVDHVDFSADSSKLAAKKFDAVSISASLLWHFSSAYHLGAALHHSERAPVVEELLSNSEVADGDEYIVHAATGVIELGNTSLQKERSNNLDVSFNWQHANNDGSISIFSNHFSDFIYLRDTGQEQDETHIYAYSQSDAVFNGIELDTHFAVHQYVDLRFWADKILGELTSGSALPRMPSARLGAEFNWQQGRWQAGMSAVHALKQDRIAPLETPTDAWTRIDASLNYTLSENSGQSVVFLRLKNIADSEIRNHVSFLKNVAPEPGRSVELGLRFSL